MLERVFKLFASLRLTVVCLAFALVLVFFGTIFQTDEGLYNVQTRYFHSLLVYWSPKGVDWKIPVFPGGYLIGAVLLINLLAGFTDRLRSGRRRLGLLMVHGGLILLVLGQFATDLLSVESHMRLEQGEPRNYSESGHDTELAIIDTSDPNSDRVYPVAEHLLARQREVQVPELPFTIRIQKYLQNSRLFRREGEVAKDPPAATQGFGPDLVLQPAPPTVKTEERNVPAAVLELVTPQGSLGTWVVSLALGQPQPVTVAGKKFTLELRATRYYKPYSITLLKFTFDKYPGSNIPKNFASRVRLQRPDTGEDREALIYMNNPLRYGGETYYQSGYDDRDPRVSILQVVRNPGWLTPYLSCALVGIGLAIQFLSHLVEFGRKRSV
jgi:hypothetical protein